MKLVPVKQAPYADQPKSPSLDNFLATGDPSRPAQSFKLTPVGQAQQPPAPPVGEGATFAGLPLPPELQPAASAVLDATGAVNRQLVNIIGGSADVANKLLGMAGQNFMKDGDATKALLDATDALGLQTKRQPVYALAGKIGNELLPAILTGAAMFAGAGPLANMAGEGLGAATGRAVGSAIRANPLTVGTGAVGGAVGSPLGEAAGPAVGKFLTNDELTKSGEQARDLTPREDANWRAVGGLTGSLLGGGLAAGAGNLLQRALGGNPVQIAGQALAPVEQDLAPIKQRISGFFEKAFQTMETPESPVTAAQKWRGALRDAFKQANREVSGLWKAVDLNQTMPSAELKALPRQITSQIANWDAEAGNVPTSIMKALAKLPAFPELRNVRAIMSQAMREARMMPKVGEGANDAKSRFLNELADGIRAQIDKHFPDDPALKAANTMTKWLHDTFDRSAVAPFAQRRMANEAGLKNAVPGANRLLTSETGGDTNAALQSALPVTKTDVAAPADQFIKAQMQQIATEKGPTQGVLWFNRPDVKRFVNAYPAMEQQADQFNAMIKPALDLQKSMRSNTFLKLMQEDPQSATGRIFNSLDPETSARETLAVLKRGSASPEEFDQAQKALQTTTIRHMFDVTNGDPATVQAWLKQGHNQAALEQVFSPGQLSRLNRLVSDAIGVGHGQETSGAKVARKTAGVFGRMIGSAVFTKMIPLPGNTLIKATAGAKLGRSISERLLKVYEPAELLSMAVQDPRWEALLLSRNPTTLEAMKRANGLLGRIAGATDYGISKAGEDPENGPLEVTVTRKDTMR